MDEGELRSGGVSDLPVGGLELKVTSGSSTSLTSPSGLLNGGRGTPSADCETWWFDVGCASGALSCCW